MTEIILSGHYDWRLVVLSIATAMYGSYAAFDLAGRMAHERNRKQGLWLAGGAMAMGVGMWAMHYIGMLAFVLPVPVLYNVPIVAFSLLAAVVSSGVALFVVSRKDMTELYLVGGSLAMGGGIAAMHYSGMAAMRLAAYPAYNVGFVSLSVVIAVVASGAALQLARLRNEAKNPGWMRVACAAVMGSAIVGTHYVGMAAVSFHFAQSIAPGNNSAGAPGLSIMGIALLTVAVLAISLIGSRVDRNFSVQRQMLAAEQERWLLVMSASQDGLFDFDLVTGQVFYSPRWKAILGYGANELDSTIETWRRLIHPADREAVEAHLQEYLRNTSGASEMEYRLCHRDGSLRWIVARSQAVWDRNGKPVRLVGSCSDITGRKRAEERLGASEAKYRELFDGNPLPSWIYSPDNLQILDVNQAAIDYYGWSRDEFVGLSVSSIRMPGEEAGSGAEFAAKDGTRRSKPWRLRRKNKSGIWVELSSHEIEVAGTPARLMIANDVTSHVVYESKIEQAKGELQSLVAQKTAELQTSEAQWRTLAEALPQFVWSTRPDGSCDYMGEQWAEYSGIPSAELLGDGWLDTVHPTDRDQVEGCWLTLVALGSSYDVQYRARAKDGSYHWFTGRARPVRAREEGPVTRWLWTSTQMDDQTPSESGQVLKGATQGPPIESITL